MKPLLNTLFVTTRGSYVHRDGETVAIRIEGQDEFRVPVHTLAGIVCFGQVSCSPQLLGLCAERRVAVSFLTESGRFLARVTGPVSGNVLLRRAQYRWADDPDRSAEIARSVVVGKVTNCRRVLQRSLRDHPDGPGAQEVAKAMSGLGGLLGRLSGRLELDEVRGHEGDAARRYFSVLDHLITVQKEEFCFRERSRRPPLDRFNALLSFLYSLLTHDVAAALESVGLDPAVGFLHRDRPGRPGLALDLMEEFRPVLVDRLALTLVNRQQIRGQGFTTTASGAVIMRDETRKTVLVAYQERKREELVHPFLKETLHVGLLTYVQALLLARCLRGDLDGYPPFGWR